MINEKGKLFGKISIIDIIVILLIAVSAFGFIYKMTSDDGSVAIKADAPIIASMKVVGVRDYAYKAIEPGDILYEQNGPRLGKVIEVSYLDSYKQLDINDGTRVFAKREGYYDVFITFEGEGRINELGHYINGTRLIAPGSEVKIHTNRLMCDSTVFSVDRG